MSKSFREQWLSAVEKKNSILCAGIDPADYAMGRTEKGEGLPAGTDKRQWTLDYVRAVAPYVAAFKPNLRYWVKDGRDLDIMNEAMAVAQSFGAVVIQDSKEPDIGSTNDAGIFNSALRGAHAITLAPYAGNMQEAAKQVKDRGIGGITMCLMSNPEYNGIKNQWVDITNDVAAYDPKHILEINGIPHTRRYMQLAQDATRFGLDGVVIGAPSSKNHLTEEEVKNAALYLGNEMLLLVPGIGAQGGEVSMLRKHFAAERLIANVGRGLMFPDSGKAYATPEDQAAAAKHYQGMLNELRLAA